MESKARDKLEAETGKSFEKWVEIARKAKVGTSTALKDRLVADHGLGSRVAWWIAQTAIDGGAEQYEDPEALVDALYSGSRADKRALHESLIDEFLALGPDVLVTACKTMIPVYRKFVFAELKPVSAGIEMHLSLGAAPTGKRLTKSPGRMADDRLTHAVVVGHADEIDAELRDWLRSAYEAGDKKAERSTSFEVPPAFAAALKKSKAAAKTWGECTPAMQRDMVHWISDAKQEATRDKRTATAIQKLAEGKRRVY